MALQTTQNNKSSLQTIKTEVVNKTAEEIQRYVDSGQLHLPADYSFDNAVKSAWLELQEVKDKNGKPALEICTKASIVNALMSMAIQGLTPSKKQCYFIAMGQALICMRSYFGDQALARRVMPEITEINASVIYAKDKLTYASENGKIVKVNHEHSLGNVSNSEIIGAYAVILGKDDRIIKIEIMTIEQIKQSWSMSRSGGKVHGEFPADMAMRTVLRKACKPIINTSTDELLLQIYKESEMAAADSEIEEEAELYANSEIIDAKATEEVEVTVDEDGVIQEPNEEPQKVPF